MEARSVLGSSDKNSHLGGKNETKHHLRWQLIQALLNILIKEPQVTTMSEHSINFTIMEIINGRVSIRLSMAKHI